MGNVLMLKRSPSSSPIKAYVIVCYSVCRYSSREQLVFTPEVFISKKKHI